MGKHSRKFELAKKNFEYSHENGGFKYKYLPQWLEFKSSKFKAETDRKSKKKFFNLRRGTLVYAQLGVNLGSEFSGNHFCIVLNKKDTSYKETITVVPLSSKPHHSYLQLDDSIIYFVMMQIGEFLETGRPVVLNTYKDVMVNQKLLLQEERVLRMKLPLNSAKYWPDFIRKKQLFRKRMAEQNDFYDNAFSQLKVILDRYRRFTGSKSYAHINSIQTISKSRLIRINDLDPTGKVTFSKESMKKIDEEIMRRFIEG